MTAARTFFPSTLEPSSLLVTRARLMRIERAISLCSCLAFFALAGCDTLPMPTAVVAGTTFTITLEDRWFDLAPSSDPNVPTWSMGFRSKMSEVGYEYDVQRGQLYFVLCPIQMSTPQPPATPSLIPCFNGGPASDPPPANNYALVTRHVTRAYVDPASNAGIYNDATWALAPGQIAQIIAMIDVPASVPAGTYRMEVRLRRQTNTDPLNPLWEYYPGKVGPMRELQVLPATSGLGFSLNRYLQEGANGWYSISEIGGAVSNIIPNPTLVIQLPKDSQNKPPAAARLVLKWSGVAGVTAPLSAFEEAHLGRGQIVRWRNGSTTGPLEISLIDPDRKVERLGVAFYPIAQPSQRLRLNKFHIEALDVYDLNGVPFAAPSNLDSLLERIR